MTVVAAVLYFVMGLVMLYSLKLSYNKFIAITRCNPTLNWDKTYCVFSKNLVLIIMIGTPFLVALMFLTAFGFVIPPDET